MNKVEYLDKIYEDCVFWIPRRLHSVAFAVGLMGSGWPQAWYQMRNKSVGQMPNVFGVDVWYKDNPGGRTCICAVLHNIDDGLSRREEGSSLFHHLDNRILHQAYKKDWHEDREFLYLDDESLDALVERIYKHFEEEYWLHRLPPPKEITP